MRGSARGEREGKVRKRGDKREGKEEKRGEMKERMTGKGEKKEEVVSLRME